MVEEVEDEDDRDGRRGDDDNDEDEDEEEDDHDDRKESHDYVVDEEKDDHDDMEVSHGYVVEKAEDDDKEVEDSDDKGEEDTHVKIATPTNLPLLLDRERESSDSGEEARPRKSTELRRSTRAKSSTIKSLWMEFQAASRMKKPKEERDIFFTLISYRPKNEEEGKIVIKMFDEDIDRQQLFFLSGVNRVNNRVFNLVCKAVMEDMKTKLWPGKRHIFNVDFMIRI
ncbi:nonsense-mediated mRNA decay protein 2-like [Neltuma alba]|uniref:nonsense-mediated mRNA decay protein 2-like n=1 Tax=Neltuma alba TaxID=207710 RepID=UPI0010A51FFA|nr:nonsense-mediated mRNA decay protein 2-like [Prosopis alba]